MSPAADPNWMDLAAGGGGGALITTASVWLAKRFGPRLGRAVDAAAEEIAGGARTDLKELVELAMGEVVGGLREELRTQRDEIARLRTRVGELETQRESDRALIRELQALLAEREAEIVGLLDELNRHGVQYPSQPEPARGRHIEGPVA